MTDTQTNPRPLSAYVPGSRWSELGNKTVVGLQPSSDCPIAVVEDGDNVVSYYSLHYAATWTPLDPAPATDALREAAMRDALKLAAYRFDGLALKFPEFSAQSDDLHRWADDCRAALASLVGEG